MSKDRLSTDSETLNLPSGMGTRLDLPGLTGKNVLNVGETILKHQTPESLRSVLRLECHVSRCVNIRFKDKEKKFRQAQASIHKRHYKRHILAI